MASTGRHELGHLESFLQELNKHEQRSNRASAEQASIRAQQRLLKEQLLQGVYVHGLKGERQAGDDCLLICGD